MSHNFDLNTPDTLSSSHILQLRQVADALSHGIKELLDDVEYQINKGNRVALDDYDSLRHVFSMKRKEQKVSLDDLSLQTDISVSTLKRLFLSPENARVGHLLSVCHELGISVWLDK
jgi:hypothetical protein